MSGLIEIPLLLLIDISGIILLLFFYHISFHIGKAMGIDKIFRIFIYAGLILLILSSIGTLVLAQFSSVSTIWFHVIMIIRILSIIAGIIGVHRHFSSLIIQCIVLRYGSKK